jgi:cell division transport system permease protein
LLIIFIAVASRSVLIETVGQLRDKVDMSIYLKTDTPADQAKAITNEVLKLSSVRKASYVSAEEARDIIAQQNKGEVSILAALNEGTNMNTGILHVNVTNIDDTSQLADFVNNDKLLKQYIDTSRKPSFAGERKASIVSIGQAINFAQSVGVIASLVFVSISSLIIFNTIRMAIFNRK